MQSPDDLLKTFGVAPDELDTASPV